MISAPSRIQASPTALEMPVSHSCMANCWSTVVAPVSPAVPPVTMNSTPSSTSTAPAMSDRVFVRIGPSVTARPRSHPFEPRSNFSHSSAISSSGLAMPSAYTAISAPPAAGEPPASATVRMAPSSGPEQKPARP